MFGAIGDPKYDNDPKAKIRPEDGLLEMRKFLGLYANIRPVKTYNSLIEYSPFLPMTIVTSHVPPPRSKIKMFCCFEESIWKP